MEFKTYQNKRNRNKFIQVKKYTCGNYYFRQFMHWETDRGPVTSYIGTKRGRFVRNGMRTLGPVLSDDYEEVRA
nr:MAG TPA: hypothetical protein [Caudoviricetes sp.]